MRNTLLTAAAVGAVVTGVYFTLKPEPVCMRLVPKGNPLPPEDRWVTVPEGYPLNCDGGVRLQDCEERCTGGAP